MSILRIEKLSSGYKITKGKIKAVRDVTFELKKGEALGLIGESGCGKTTLIKSILRVLPENGQITSGQVFFNDVNILSLPEKEMQKIRFKNISLIAQGAMNALDPVYRVENQIIETIMAHEKISKKKALSKSEELFAYVELEPSKLKAFPHELSGGMKQRVIIAMALSLNPEVIIADEPTTGLDVIVQDHILREITSKHYELGNSLIYISHDISMIAETCDRIAVMYAGEIVELCDVNVFFHEPCHPYSMGLIKAYPTIAGAKSKEDLVSIPGYPPNLLHIQQSCLFSDRCPFSQDICRTSPPLFHKIGNRHYVRCHFANSAKTNRIIANEPSTWLEGKHRQIKTSIKSKKPVSANLKGQSGNELLLLNGNPKNSFNDEKSLLYQINNLVKEYSIRGNIIQTIFSKKENYCTAINGITMNIYCGETLGIAGESGCGKSTLGEILVQLQNPTRGDIYFQGNSLISTNNKLNSFRKQVQMIFQDPYQSLNPRFTVYKTVVEPLVVNNIGNPEDQYKTVLKALEDVELRPAIDFVNRFPRELSGGQRQRVGIARCVVIKPNFIVADEPVSMLDVSIRAGILNLLCRLKKEMNLTILYISHNLANVRYIADRIAIMYLGEIVEIAPSHELPKNALHPYTKALFAATPIGDPSEKRPPVPIIGELSRKPSNKKSCIFVERCPYAFDLCHKVQPLLKKYQKNHLVSCHLANTDLKA